MKKTGEYPGRSRPFRAHRGLIFLLAALILSVSVASVFNAERLRQDIAETATSYEMDAAFQVLP